MLPGCVPCVLSRLQVLVSPEMMNHIQASYLREEATDCFTVMLAVANSSSPIIAPFNHGTRSQLVGSELIYIWPASWHRLVPEAELQKKLIPTGEKHFPPFIPVLHEHLVIPQFTHDFSESWISSSVPPQVHSLVLFSIPGIPCAHQLTWVMFVIMDGWQHLIAEFVVRLQTLWFHIVKLYFVQVVIFFLS